MPTYNTTTLNALVDNWNLVYTQNYREMPFFGSMLPMLQGQWRGDTLLFPDVGDLTAYNDSGRDAESNPPLQRLTFGTKSFTIDYRDVAGAEDSLKNLRENHSIFTEAEWVATAGAKASDAMMRKFDLQAFTHLLGAQTASSTNLGAGGLPHRFVASGTNGALTLADLDAAMMSLYATDIPMNGAVAIMHPADFRNLQRDTAFVNVLSPNPYLSDFERGRTVPKGFVGTIPGLNLEIYVTSTVPALSSSETIDGRTATTSYRPVFVLPYLTGMGNDSGLPFKQMEARAPGLIVEVNDIKDMIYAFIRHTYGFALWRNDAIVTILSQPIVATGVYGSSAYTPV